jgi:hypothetical protein
MTRPARSALAAMLAVAAPAGALAQASPEQGPFHARLSGYEEVPPVSTGASGQLVARVVGDAANVTIEYELRYTGFTAAPAAAHIHFAQEGVNGAVSAFLCGGGDKPACPAEGEVRGTIDAADVVGPEDRGIATGEIKELVRAMEAGATYANVHSGQYPEGEIRGQIEERVAGR